VDAERKRGSAALPARCQPDSTQQCALCDAVSWEQAEEVGCLVFLRGAPVKTTFVTYSCSTHGCNGTLDADGIEFGLMRKTKEVAFGHCLLYAWVDEVSSHRSVTFHGFWHTMLKAYKR
jgi:hypothetical protein